MKRIAFIFASLVLAISMVGAQSNTAPTTSMPMQITGSTILGIENKNIGNSSFVAALPGMTGQTATADLALQFIFNTNQSYIDVSQYLDEVRKQNILGFDAGVTFDAANLYSFTAATSPSSKSTESSMYSKIQSMLDWYDNNYLRFGMPKVPTAFSSGEWPTTSYGSGSGRTRFIYGQTLIPADRVIWNSNSWSDAEALYNDLNPAILNEIGNISSNCNGGKINQFVILTATEQNIALNEKRAYEEYNAAVFGSSTAASFAGPVIKNAYLALYNIAGLIDSRFDFAGVKLNATGAVKSPRAEQLKTGSSITLKLAPGIVSGFRFGVQGAITGGEPIVIENYDTNIAEYKPGKASWFGLSINTGYNFGQFIKFANVDAGLTFVFPDLIERMDTFAAKLVVSYVQNGALTLDNKLELQGLMWEDREIAGDVAVLGFAGALIGKVNYLGMGIHYNAKYKSEEFGGYNLNNVEDRFAGFSLDQDFDSVGNGWALSADMGALLESAAVLGLDVGSIDIGGQAFIYNGLDLNALLGVGYYANITMRAKDALNIPVSLVLSANSYNNTSGLTKYNDAKNLPVASFMDGLGYSVKLVYKASDNLLLSAKFDDQDSRWKKDTARIMSAGVSAEIKF